MTYQSDTENTSAATGSARGQERLIQPKNARASDGSLIEWTSTGDGPALLLIAGQGVSQRSWAPLVPGLARHFRVLTYDVRGVGDSEPGADERFNTRLLAEDAVAVLDAAGVSRASVYGHSMGGRIAQWMAVDHSERIDKLILGATTGGDALGSRRAKAATDRLVSGDPELLSPLFFTSEFASARPDQVTAFFRRSSSRRVQSLLFRASAAHDAWVELPGVLAPTLILHGDRDEVTPVDHAYLLREHIPGSILRVLPRQLHGYVLESASSMRHLINFLGVHGQST